MIVCAYCLQEVGHAYGCPRAAKTHNALRRENERLRALFETCYGLLGEALAELEQAMPEAEITTKIETFMMGE